MTMGTLSRRGGRAPASHDQTHMMTWARNIILEFVYLEDAAQRDIETRNQLIVCGLAIFALACDTEAVEGF